MDDDDENMDHVADLVNTSNALRKKADTLSSASGMSRVSKTSSQYIINGLEEQLDQERVERQRIQYELEEMRKVNAEISSKLGLSSNQQQE